MLQQDEPDDYVIATGEAHSVRELVEVAFAHVGLDPDKHVRIDPALPAPRRGRAPDRRRLEGAREARLGAADELRGDGAADGRCRSRAAGQRGASEAGRLRWPARRRSVDFAVVGGGILGLAVARELGIALARPRASRCSSASCRGRHRADRRQQRRHPRRHLLQARLAQGAALRDRRARALLLLRAALDPARALRQADRRASRGRAGTARRARAARP